MTDWIQKYGKRVAQATTSAPKLQQQLQLPVMDRFDFSIASSLSA